jgi:predicted short-subunit dehydrogenase-like oxidoreductase (DUF2520 family)
MHDKTIQRDSIAIIGLGKVGTAVGYLLRTAGYTIVAVAGRSLENLRMGLRYTGGQVYTDNAEAASCAECVLITTSDDAIALVCEEISQKGALRAGKKVIHMSGAGGLDLLASARRAGAFVASIHPIQSFAHVEGAIKSIPGSTFGITADEEIKQWAEQMVRDIGGSPFQLADTDKALYHAAACLASNYLTTLMHTVEEIYQSLGMEREDALRAFWPLVRGTLENIETKGAVQALTGPISRGDAGTIEKHLSALRERLPGLLPLYCEMGIKTVDIGLKKKTLPPDKAEIIKTFLKGGS